MHNFGWICPINTVIRTGNFIGKKIGTQKKLIPKFFKTKALRIIILLAFIVALAYTIYTMITGKKFPLPVIIIVLGVLVTIFINENTWHRYLCPWGILLNITGKFTKRNLNVNQEGCISCKKCYNVCPAEAIDFKEKAKIMPKYCLLCYKCHDECPINVIKYRKI